MASVGRWDLLLYIIAFNYVYPVFTKVIKPNRTNINKTNKKLYTFININFYSLEPLKAFDTLYILLVMLLIHYHILINHDDY